MLVHSSGTEAVMEMATVTKLKMNARRLAFCSEQVKSVDFKQ